MNKEKAKDLLNKYIKLNDPNGIKAMQEIINKPEKQTKLFKFK